MTFRELLSRIRSLLFPTKDQYDILVEHNQRKREKERSVDKQLSELRTGDLVLVILKPEFCQNMKAQVQERFYPEDLEEPRRVKGVVYLSVFHPDLKCMVLELLTAKRDSSSGVVKKTYTILSDEVEAIHKVANDTPRHIDATQSWKQRILPRAWTTG